MQIVLPSAGIIGFKSLNLKQPTYKLVKSLADVEDVDIHLKNRFLKPLVDVDLSELTSWDRDYIYIIVFSSMCMNTLTFNKLFCPSCKKVHKYDYKIEEVDVYDLPEGSELITQKVHDESTWKFKVPQVKDEEMAFELCYKMIGEFDQKLYDNLLVSRFISKANLPSPSPPLFDYKNKETFSESIKKLPTQIYLAGHAFIHLSFHGISNSVSIVCPHCSKKRIVKLNIPATGVKLSSATLMALFVDVCDYLSYSEFLDMTFSDYNALVKTLNN